MFLAILFTTYYIVYPYSTLWNMYIPSFITCMIINKRITYTYVLLSSKYYVTESEILHLAICNTNRFSQNFQILKYIIRLEWTVSKYLLRQYIEGQHYISVFGSFPALKFESLIPFDNFSFRPLSPPSLVQWGTSRACVKLVRPLFHVIYMNTRTWDYRFIVFISHFLHSFFIVN